MDIIGDIHGELDSLKQLLNVMGYSEAGVHPEGRKLVFVGDLTDRGPDSPGVIDFVDQLITEELGYCVLGNHDLNLLLGETKHDNGWFFGDEFLYKEQLIPQALADDSARAKTIDPFQRLPLVLERDGLRIVHTYWNQRSVDAVRGQSDAVEVFQRHVQRIQAQCDKDSADKIDMGLLHQNDNPVKLPSQRFQRGVNSTLVTR